ncbi:hypothetical protein FOZ62_013563, partial [Perkinsus olseni]
SVGEPRLPREDAFYDLADWVGKYTGEEYDTTCTVGKYHMVPRLIPNMITVPLGTSVLMSDEIDCDYEDYDAIVAVAGAEGVISGDVVEDHAKDKEAEADGRKKSSTSSVEVEDDPDNPDKTKTGPES